MRRSLIVAGAAVVVAVLLFPTMGTPLTDDHDEIEGLELAPSSGPNGAYAEIARNGELRLNLSEENQELAGDGVNDRAETAIDGIFTITNGNDETVEIWLETGVESEDIWFYHGSAEKAPLDEESPVPLQPMETVSVGVFIDTTTPDHRVDEIADFSVHAVPVDETDDQRIDQPTEGSDEPSDDPTDGEQDESPTKEPPDDDDSDHSDEPIGDPSDEGDTDDSGKPSDGSSGEDEPDDTSKQTDDESETESSGAGSGSGPPGERTVSGVNTLDSGAEVIGGAGLWVMVTLLLAAVVGALGATAARHGLR